MHRDPPHYLKPLSTTTTPRRLAWLACRGYVSRRRQHYEQHFQAAALGTTHWTTRTNKRKDSLTTFNDPAELWDAVAAWCPQSRRVVLFAYDLAEQMRLSQMLTHLPRMGWDLDKIVLERTAAWCLLRNGKRSLMCCDLKSWCPVPWEKIVGDVRNTGLLLDPIAAGPGLSGEVCAQRVIVLRTAILQILDWIEGEGLGSFRPTGSGQSYTAYRRRFMNRRLLVHDDTARLHAERLAMHTGRAEAWRVGNLRGGPYVEYDLHAAYATIGRDCAVPTIARGQLNNPSPARVLRTLDRYAVLADITVTTDVECLPFHVNKRTMWPVGTFRTTVWEPELRLAFNYADKVKVHRAWLYQRDYALRDFCTWVLDNMESQTQIYGLVPQRVLKHWSRCLVGRLGLRYRAWHKFGPQHPPDVRLVTFLDLDEDTRTDMLLAGTQRLLLGDLTEGTESLPQIPGWVMSECRSRLWDAMTVADPHKHLIYCDTDSVIFDGFGAGCIEAKRYGDGRSWVQKGSYPSMTIYGPRNLMVGSDRRVSGLPLSARQHAPLEFSGEVMRGVKQAMRNGELDCVVSTPRTYHLNPIDLRRQHNQDGTTKPFHIQEA